MGSFKRWLEEIQVNSDGQAALPSQVAQDTVQIANQYMNNPQNAPTMQKLATQGMGKPSIMKNLTLQAGADAAKQSKIAPQDMTVNSPQIANQIWKNVAPKMHNPFKSTIKPV